VVNEGGSDAAAVADVRAELRWSGGQLRFAGNRLDGPEIRVDGDGAAGPSPMTLLLLSLAGCMGADIVDICTKMRLPLGGLEIAIEGDRRAEPPRRYTAIRMTCSVSGVDVSERAKVQRAVDMSRDTYCSVMHSLRDDIEVSIGLELR
jgi:putative redox protein